MEEGCQLHGIYSHQSYFRVEVDECTLLFDAIKYSDQTRNSCH
jgi:hypothetical protein